MTPMSRRLLSVRLLLLLCCCCLSRRGIAADDGPTVFVGGLYTAHDSSQSGSCDRLRSENVVLAMAQRFAVDYVNKEILSPEIAQLYSLFVDTCNDRASTLRHIVGMLKEERGYCHQASSSDDDDDGTNLTAVFETAIGRHEQPHQHVRRSLLHPADGLAPDERETLDRHVVAFSGAFEDPIAETSNYLLQAYCIPLIASTTTSSTLDDLRTFPYFARTVPSDVFKAQVIFDLIISQFWWHVSVVYDASSSGQSLLSAFRQAVEVCTAPSIIDTLRAPCVEHYFPVDFTNQNTLKEQLESLKFGMESTHVGVYVFLMSKESINQMLPYLTAWGKNAGQIQIIISNIADEPKFIPPATYAVVPHLTTIANFSNYLQSFTLASLQGDDVELQWLTEVIERDNLCCWQGSTSCPYSMQCKGDEVILSATDDDLRDASRVLFAIAMIAHGLFEMTEKKCNTDSSVACPTLNDVFSGPLFMETMMNLSVVYTQYGVFEAWNNSGAPYFDVLQWQPMNDTSAWMPVMLSYNPTHGPEEVAEGLFDTVQVENWQGIDNDSHTCQKPCVKSVMNLLPASSCCWTCVTCPRFHIANETRQECQECPSPYIPNDYVNACIPMERPPLIFTPTAAEMTLLALCGTGCLLTVASVLLIFHFRQTPIVKASTPDLACTQGVILCITFATVVLLLPNSSAALCGAGWAISTILIAATHSVFVVKAMRQARIGLFTKFASSVGHSKVRASLLIIAITTLCQAFISGLWILLRPPSTVNDREIDSSYCSSSNEVQTAVLFILPLFLLALSAIFQKVASRNTPLEFQMRQAQFSLIGSFCFALIYLVLTPLLFIEEPRTEIKVLALMCIPFFSALVAWVSMLAPTGFDLLFRRTHNVHEYVSRQRDRRFRQGNTLYFVDSVTLNRRRATREQLDIPAALRTQEAPRPQNGHIRKG